MFLKNFFTSIILLTFNGFFLLLEAIQTSLNPHISVYDLWYFHVFVSLAVVFVAYCLVGRWRLFPWSRTVYKRVVANKLPNEKYFPFPVIKLRLAAFTWFYHASDSGKCRTSSLMPLGFAEPGALAAYAGRKLFSTHDRNFEYVFGREAKPVSDFERGDYECTSGIHFYLRLKDAQAH